MKYSQEKIGQKADKACRRPSKKKRITLRYQNNYVKKIGPAKTKFVLKGGAMMRGGLWLHGALTA